MSRTVIWVPSSWKNTQKTITTITKEQHIRQDFTWLCFMFNPFNIYINSRKSGKEGLLANFVDKTELQETPSTLESKIRIQKGIVELKRWNWIQTAHKLFLLLMENSLIQSLVLEEPTKTLQVTLRKTCPIGQAPLTRLGTQ